MSLNVQIEDTEVAIEAESGKDREGARNPALPMNFELERRFKSWFALALGHTYVG